MTIASTSTSISRVSSRIWITTATVSFGAGCWQNTGTRRRADVPQQQERQHSILVSRQGLHSGLAMLVVAVCLFVMGVFWLNLQSQIQNVSTQIGVRTTNINAKQQENDTLQAQISVATKEQSLLQRAQKLGMKEGKNVQVVELSGVPDAICGLQEGAPEHHDHHGRGAAVHMQ